MSAVFVVHQCPNPSTDFFVAPALLAESRDVRTFTFDQVPDLSELTGATVVFVRYVPPAWKALVTQHPPARVVLFMDDDLFDWRAFRGMPWRYQRKLFRLAWRHQRWLRQVRAELWVSSPWLARKYWAWGPRVLEPRNPYPLPENVSDPDIKTLFYHGSASHRAEIEWLVPIIEQVLGEREDVCFEVIGDRKVRDRLAHLPGVQVVHPMSWVAYRRFVCRPGRTIGLAPLLDTRFNAARAPTKFFDITAAGAVGIYADTPVYQGLLKHGQNGLLLSMDTREIWVDEIGRLLSSPKLRSELYANACLR